MQTSPIEEFQQTLRQESEWSSAIRGHTAFGIRSDFPSFPMAVQSVPFSLIPARLSFSSLFPEEQDSRGSLAAPQASQLMGSALRVLQVIPSLIVANKITTFGQLSPVF